MLYSDGFYMEELSKSRGLENSGLRAQSVSLSDEGKSRLFQGLIKEIPPFLMKFEHLGIYQLVFLHPRFVTHVYTVRLIVHGMNSIDLEYIFSY